MPNPPRAAQAGRAARAPHERPAPLPAPPRPGAAAVRLLLLALVALAAALRGYGLADHALWLDEVITLHRASLPPAALVADSFASLHFPTYFLLMAGVTGLFGDGNLALRLPSLLFGVLCVPLGYAVARRLAGPVAGLATAALIALAPIQIAYAQEARSYALLGLFIWIALWGFVRIASDPALAGMAPGAVLRPPDAGGRAGARAARAGWAAFIAGTAGALLTLSIAVVWLAAALAGLFALRNELTGAARRNFTRTALLALGAVALVVLPWAAALAPSLFGVARDGFWTPPATLADFATAIWAFYLFGVVEPVGFQPLAPVAPWRVAILLAAIAAGAWSLRRARAVLVLLLVLALLPPLAFMTVGQVFFVPRYLFPSPPALLLLAGCGIAFLLQFIRRPAVAAFFALLLFIDLSINLRSYYQAEIKPRWDLAAALIDQSLRENDRVLFHSGFARWVVETELRRTETPLSAHTILSEPAAIDPATFTGSIFVAHGRFGHFPGPDDAEIRTWLAAWGEPDRIEQLGKEVQIWLYEFTPPQSPASAPDPS